MQMLRMRCHNFEPNRPVGVMVKHIAIGAGGFGFDFWASPSRLLSCLAHRLSVRKVWSSIPGMVKSAQCRQRLATAATFLCYPKAQRWAPVTFAKVGSQHSPSLLTIAEKMKPFFKRSDFSSCGACENCYHVFIPNNTIPHKTF